MADADDGDQSAADPVRVSYGAGREALLKAAITVVAQGGLRSLTYRSVAAEAGVAHGLVRHHFGSRDALIEQALRYSIAVSIDTTSLESTTGRIDDLARDLATSVAADPDSEAFQYELILEARRRPELSHYVKLIYEAYRGSTRRTLQAAGLTDPDLADLVFVTLDGLVFQQIALGDADATERGLTQLRRLLEGARRAQGLSPTRPTRRHR